MVDSGLFFDFNKFLFKILLLMIRNIACYNPAQFRIYVIYDVWTI